ncbi:type IV conjugative transfer system pilin TraA, partial [Salmonella enterica subsp. enterica serovar Oslo]
YEIAQCLVGSEMCIRDRAMAAGKGTDLMAKGQETVKATFGKDSSIVKWVVLAEVLVGAVMYMMTKNVKFLVGFAILSVFIAVGTVSYTHLTLPTILRV